MAAHIRIGISGWRYAPWRKVFYPDELRQADELHFASRALPTIEINGTFYAQQRPRATPGGTPTRLTASCSASRPRATSPTSCG